MSSAQLATMASMVRAGMPLAEVRLRYQVALEVDQALALCERFGSPPAAVLDRLATVAVAHERARAELQLAAAGPKASARLVLLLPLLVVAIAQLCGLQVLNRPDGITLGSMVFGGTLLLIGRSWSNRIIQRSEPELTDPGLAVDAFASGLQGGLAPEPVAEQVQRVFGSSLVIPELIARSREDGLAIANLALAEADRMRSIKRIEDETRIRQAAVKLMWPLGLAVLPAFLLLAVIPLAASMLRGN